ncbi:MAG TPA: universal stress protein [Candidatus Deferrimicrobiaceae bacterium]|nr:universal stress protein [Candidatus Deferrimicrobiaceae bacterium]
MTTKKILLAVDRSPRTDAVAAIVADTARGAHATARLLHVAPEPSAVHNAEGRVVVYADQETESLTSEGLDYLRTLEVHFGDVPVEGVVRFGDPVAEILAAGQRGRAGLREGHGSRDARAAHGRVMRAGGRDAGR